jgi:hypothetical protein
MPLRSDKRPLTEGQTALELFTDRRHARQRFESYLDDEAARPTILFFSGDGGNGKSLLLRFLAHYYCEGHDPRRWADATPDAPTAHRALIPNAMLDFAPLPGGDESHQRAVIGLLRLRRELGEDGLRFPLFDYASILYLKRSEGLTADRLKALFPAAEADLVAALVDVVSETSVGAIGKTVLGLFDKYFGQRANERFTLWLQRRGINGADIEALHRMDPERELLQELPHLFAEDLNTAMRGPDAPRRVVLFFDTHEAFWGEERDLSGDRYFARDEWLRRLLASLDRRLGIVVVVAGRERPRWQRADPYPIDENAVDECRV